MNEELFKTLYVRNVNRPALQYQRLRNFSMLFFTGERSELPIQLIPHNGHVVTLPARIVAVLEQTASLDKKDGIISSVQGLLFAFVRNCIEDIAPSVSAATAKQPRSRWKAEEEQVAIRFANREQAEQMQQRAAAAGLSPEAWLTKSIIVQAADSLVDGLRRLVAKPQGLHK